MSGRYRQAPHSTVRSSPRTKIEYGVRNTHKQQQEKCKTTFQDAENSALSEQQKFSKMYQVSP